MKQEHRTKDLGEAAALVTKGVKLIQLLKDSDFYWFIFELDNESDLSNLYWSGELQVSAKQFNDNLRSLKDRLFAQ